MGKKNKKRKKQIDPDFTAGKVDKFVLYEASVQSPESNLLFSERTFKSCFGRAPALLREDFCGTGRLACEWASWEDHHEAWGVDLHRPTLKWGEEHHVRQLGETGRRVHLIKGNVLSEQTPAADITVAFNFSYWIFKTREQLRTYFKKVYDGLGNEGVFVMDIFGGTAAGDTCEEEREIEDKLDWQGHEVPAFTYIWEQAKYNAVTHDMHCYIHFQLPDGSRLDRAFSYEWRLWSIPEIRELLAEAGFRQSKVYTHGWTEDGESDDQYNQADIFDNEGSWLGYIAGVKKKA